MSRQSGSRAKAFVSARSIPGFGRRNRLSRRSSPELKYNDIAVAAYAADTTGSITCLNLTAVGDDNTTRDGRQINNKSIHVQGLLTPNDSVAGPNWARLMLLWDTQPNGALPAVTDILTAATSTANTNLNNRQRFIILRDIKLAQGINDNTATMAYSNGNNTYTVDTFIPLGGLKTTYSGTTAAITSVSSNALLMLTIGSQAAGSAGTFGVTTRLRFTDF